MGISEIKQNIGENHEKVDEVKDRRQVIGMCDDFAGDAENITGFYQT